MMEIGRKWTSGRTRRRLAAACAVVGTFALVAIVAVPAFGGVAERGKYVSKLAIPSQPPLPKCESQDCFVPAAPEPGTAIPGDSVKLGIAPAADNAFYVIPAKNGWFKQVGITIGPQWYGFKTTIANAMSLLLRNSLNVEANYMPALVPLLGKQNAVKQIMLHDDFYAFAIMANPKLGLKTVSDYMKQGLPFKTALRRALEPVSKPGTKMAITAAAFPHPFMNLVFKTAGLPRPQLQQMDDQQTLLLAQNGSLDYALPSAAPIILQMMNERWTRLVTVKDMMAHLPAGPRAEIEQIVGTVGMAANTSWVKDHPNTVLRLESVIYRTMDHILSTRTFPADAANFINSYTASKLSQSDFYRIMTDLDPLSPWSTQASRYWENPKDPRYYKNSLSALIATYQQQGVIPKNKKFTPDDVTWGKQIFQTMKWYRNQTDRILRSLKGRTLSKQQRAYVATAQKFYGWHNYLDAFRNARAAAQQ